ncbi:nucleotidyltransferase domain-containing protein [Gemmatimonadota bacterium]
MRPPKRPSSFFYHPVDLVLGTVATVRVTRELANHGGALSATDLASRAGLSIAGTVRALDRLQGVGVVEAIGTGRGAPFRLLTENPLSLAIVALFEMEHGQTQAIYDAVDRFASENHGDVMGVWLYGSVARGEERPDSDVDVLLVARTGLVAKLSAELSEMLLPLSEWSLPVSVVGVSPDDLERMAESTPERWEQLVDEAVVLAGKAPREIRHGKAQALEES